MSQYTTVIRSNTKRRKAEGNFEMLTLELECPPYNFHVDLRVLAELGGPLFTSWKVKQEAGVDFVEVTDMSPEDVKVLIHATARFGSIVIHKDNYLVMSILASQYRMLTVLREVESYLIAANMPLMRKLEFAAELRMARLYDATMREIGPNAVEELHRYLRDNGDRLQDVHWMLRSALGLNNDYVCIP
ncbi:hypothetical protein OESDEN_11010 [Oesophagostomum dentatum]|uniref:Uncharacterized protein n=1 Tax=Oesophagostomum dentatum TaxID=61180 RepID=A0A0B1SV74_OESDE|nr:hypothetical protein OESDEN_11010 [Oesophagostomum dentatum]